LLLLGTASIISSVRAQGFEHDVAVIDVKPYRDWVYENRPIDINVTVTNLGSSLESTNVTLFYNFTDGKKIGEQLFDLESAETKTLKFTWDTVGVPHCHNYTITAVATINFDEDPSNNMMDSSTKVKVRIYCDVNGDGKIDFKDISIAAHSAFGAYPGHPRWNEAVDVNFDGRIDMRDVSIICKRFGTGC